MSYTSDNRTNKRKKRSPEQQTETDKTNLMSVSNSRRVSNGLFHILSHMLLMGCLHDILGMQVLLANLRNQSIQLGVARLGMPWLGSVVTEEFLHFFDGFAAGFGVSVYWVSIDSN